MNKFLPSKKLTVFLGVFLLLLFGFLLISKYQDRKIAYRPAQNIENEIAVEMKKITQSDSDGDGLKDWEETLWKTDPNNPDTDGDGTNDNAEILAGRNPLIAGPNDLLKNEIVQSAPDDAQAGQTLTQTDRLARELFVGYAALKQEGQLNGANQDRFIEALVEKNLGREIKEIYSLTDLKIISNNHSNIQTYANEIKKLTEKIPELKYEPLVLKQAMEINNPGMLKELDFNILTYKQMIGWFLEIPVPSAVAEFHLNVINALNEMTADTKNMQKMFSDPIAGLLGVQKYIKDEEKFNNALTEIGEYFKTENIVF
ncbi:MAG: hypothetical protein KAV41_00625 [Candidatus Pacebacteria bacterium]|nr:hypothetical protein [Candidatus Paceibacterota bacterium]